MEDLCKKLSDEVKVLFPQQNGQSAEAWELDRLIRIAKKMDLHHVTRILDDVALKMGAYGCHVELEDTISGEPDECVIQLGRPQDCIYAKNITTPSQCKYWQPIIPKIENIDIKMNK